MLRYSNCKLEIYFVVTSTFDHLV